MEWRSAVEEALKNGSAPSQGHSHCRRTALGGDAPVAILTCTVQARPPGDSDWERRHTTISNSHNVCCHISAEIDCISTQGSMQGTQDLRLLKARKGCPRREVARGSSQKRRRTGANNIPSSEAPAERKPVSPRKRKYCCKCFANTATA